MTGVTATGAITISVEAIMTIIFLLAFEAALFMEAEARFFGGRPLASLSMVVPLTMLPEMMLQAIIGNLRPCAGM